MIKPCGPEALRVGMFVKIPARWFSHPFARNQFLIRSESDLEKLRSSGIKSFLVDTERSSLPSTQGGETRPEGEPEPGMCWTPRDLVPPALLEALSDPAMPPEQKASAIHEYSREMMARLLDTPTAENIQEARKVIGQIAETVIAEDVTSEGLLRITAHDFYTYTHSVNVGVKGLILAKEVFRKSDAHDLLDLAAGFFLHDLGKVAIDKAIINKVGKLTEEEFGKMRLHPQEGFHLLQKTNQLTQAAKIIVLQHHERDDGRGYPRKLKGGEIHPYARICALVDIYDALTSERSYKKKLPPDKALQIIQKEVVNERNRPYFSVLANLVEQHVLEG